MLLLLGVCQNCYSRKSRDTAKGRSSYTLANLNLTVLKSAVVGWLASGISKPGVAALRSWWSALGQGTFSSLVLVCLPRDHE